MPTDAPVPLYVDLDGTLLRTDLLWEGICALARRSPLWLLAVPLWLVRGKAFFKTRLAGQGALDVSTLPVDEDLLQFVRHERATGRRVIAASGSPRPWVEAVAASLGVFDDLLATDGEANLIGAAKRDAILRREGRGPFDYAGNASADLPIWGAARHAILVRPSAGVERAARRVTRVEHVFPARTGRAALLRTVRVHQWLKNLLLFVPLIASHQIAEPGLLMDALRAFLAFGLCASGVYVSNDLLDLESDRRHPRKRRRPFAAGEAPIAAGAGLAPLLLIAGGLLAATLPPRFGLFLALYVGTALAYSLRLKRIVLLDVLVLAGLYTLRVLAGAAAVRVYPSFWLLAFSMFVFLSLALVKRSSELSESLEPGDVKGLSSRGRDYQPEDLEVIRSLGAASGYLAVLVLALYLNSRDVAVLYRHPARLWLLCPVLLYWISRVWIVTARGQLRDDPVLFALKDRVSWVVGGLCAVIVALAT